MVSRSSRTLLCLTCISLCLGSPFHDIDERSDEEETSAPDEFSEVEVSFTLRRPTADDLIKIGVTTPVEDPFCSEEAGYITLHSFYRTRNGINAVGEWSYLQSTSLPLEPENATVEYSALVPTRERGTQLAVLQLEHAGGQCDAWVVDKIFFSSNFSSLVYSASCAVTGISDIVFIRESSSSLRGFITHWILNNGTTLEECVEAEGKFTPRVESLFSLPDLPQPHDLLCNNTDRPFMDLSFLIHWAYDKDCDSMDFFDEGIELSVRRVGDLLWVPLAFFTRVTRRRHSVFISLDYSNDNLMIRGYTVPIVTLDETDIQHHMQFRLCNDSIFESQRGVEFRWLQTVEQMTGSGPRDMWSLDDVTISVTHDSTCSGVTVFHDDFETDGTTADPRRWPAQRRANIGQDIDLCNANRTGSVVWFTNFTQVAVQSRLIATRPIMLQRPAVCAPLELEQELLFVLNLLHIDLIEGADALLEYVTTQPSDEVNITQVISLTSIILEILGDTLVSPELSQTFINIAGQLTAVVSTSQLEVPISSDGSILLANLDQFALNNHNPISGDIISDTLELTVRSGSGESGDEVRVIDKGTLSLSLPKNLFTSRTRDTVYASSYLYRNLSGFLGNALPGDQSGSSLLGPVLSSFLHSTNEPLEFTDISPPVRVTFPYSDTPVPTCVFWNFDSSGGGSWDTSRCETIQGSDIVTCECNHLTHFALLLSPGIETDEGVTVSLEVIGIVGVSVSLVALILTIVTFLVFRSLWSLRNYIHIQLCVSLLIAQLLFVVGVEPRGSEAACTTVAVLLHYAFLVSFMWMLMEGAVLYVALVKVFDVRHLKYAIAFTVISYGAPLLYMVLCIPLGLALGDGYYGYDEACWLRYDTHFIWAFITPVILIILINTGFFVMAIAIMCRHQRSQAHLSNIQQIRHWIKASISLLVVMGMTWVIGILVFSEALLPLAYVFTIFVAFQGVVIFVVLVVLSKQVRDTYIKWWKAQVVNSEFVSKLFSERTKTTMTDVQNSDALTDKAKVTINGSSFGVDLSLSDQPTVTSSITSQ